MVFGIFGTHKLYNKATYETLLTYIFKSQFCLLFTLIFYLKNYSY